MGRCAPKTTNYCLMKIYIMCEGRLNKGDENILCQKYISRTLSLKNSGIQNLEIKKITEKKIEKTIIKNKNSISFIMDEKGFNFTTRELSEKIKQFNNERVENLYFYIGKPSGFSENVDKFQKISLGKMTFPHSLVRVMLCEQIYRCATILSNHPYHKE